MIWPFLTPAGNGSSVATESIARIAPPTGRLAFLDSLRFLAALAVLLQHLLEHGRAPAMGWFIQLGPGVFGVALFFILSGFVIPFSVKRGFDPISFAVGRLFRIYPLVLVAFAAALLLGRAGLPDFAEAARATPADWVANLLLIFDFVGNATVLGVAWTLIIEFAWYGLFASTLLLFRDKAGRVLEIATPILFVALTLASLLLDHRVPLGRIGMIYAAVTGYQAWRHYEGQIGTRRFVIDATLFLVVMAFGNVVAFGHFHHPNITMAQAVWPWFISSAIFLTVYAVPAIRRSALLSNRIVAGLGAISFSTYLLHPFAIAIARHWLGGGAMIAAALVLTLLLSIAGYTLVERPAMRLGRHLARKPQPAIVLRAV